MYYEYFNTGHNGMMENRLEQLRTRYPQITECIPSIMAAFLLLRDSFTTGNKVLIAGNGGSASDADHIVGELMKGFLYPRRLPQDMRGHLCEIDEGFGMNLADKLQGALPAIALSNHNSLNSAFLNDVDGHLCFAQQVLGYGSTGDVFLGISTSGNAQNVIYAAVTAKAKNMTVIGLTGRGGGQLARYSDVLIDVDETETYKVQELHLPIYHCLCMMLEEHFFS